MKKKEISEEDLNLKIEKYKKLYLKMLKMEVPQSNDELNNLQEELTDNYITLEEMDNIIIDLNEPNEEDNILQIENGILKEKLNNIENMLIKLTSGMDKNNA